MIRKEYHKEYRVVSYFVVSSALVFLLSSCVYTKNYGGQPGLHEQELEEKNRKLSAEVNTLQQKLLDKQGEIKKLILSGQLSTREVVRSKAKLRSHSSKAETVASIAEVKTMLKAAQGQTMSEQLQLLVSETEETIALSVAALNNGDIEKAFELSNRAQQLIRPAHTQQGKNPFNNGLDMVFVDPLLMKVTKSCNVRTDPGMQNAVLFTLGSGTEIKALAYVTNWIQVESEKKGKGWVYYQLLEIVP